MSAVRFEPGPPPQSNALNTRPLQYEQVCVEARTSALNMTLPATAVRAPADINRYLASGLLSTPGLR